MCSCCCGKSGHVHHIFILPWKVRQPPPGFALSFSLPPCTPRFIPPSISPPASALCGRSCRYGTDTSAATQSYFRNCCLCCLLTIRARSEFPSAVSTNECSYVLRVIKPYLLSAIMHYRSATCFLVLQ